jgi:DNA polymerase-3 subunit delta'
MSRAASSAEPGAPPPLLESEDAAFDRLAALPFTAPANLALLAGAQERGRLSHALLLTGPRGSGKRWCAVRLAQILACEQGAQGGAPGLFGAPPSDPARPCLRCGACTRTERGLDPDVFVLEPPWDEKKGEMKGEIPVEQVRRLQERLTFRSDGSRRFVIVDPADRLSLIAQEALLKTLEEPPRGVTIALLSERASFLKPTVRSRSQSVRFAAPSRAALADELRACRGLDARGAALAADLAGGDVRRAQRLDPDEEHERWIALARRLYEVLGARGESRARDLAVEVAALRESDGGRDEIAAWLDRLEAILRDAMLLGEASGAGGGAGSCAPLLNPAAAHAAEAIATRLAPDRAVDALAAIEEARDDLALHLGAKVVLTHLLLTVHGLRDIRRV